MNIPDLFIEHDLFKSSNTNIKYIILNEHEPEIHKDLLVLFPLRLSDFELIKEASQNTDETFYISYGKLHKKFIKTAIKVNRVDDKFLSKLIPRAKVKTIKGDIITSWKCYSIGSHYDYRKPDPTLIIHEDVLSVKNCINGLLNNPDAYLILKFDRNETNVSETI